MVYLRVSILPQGGRPGVSGGVTHMKTEATVEILVVQALVYSGGDSGRGWGGFLDSLPKPWCPYLAPPSTRDGRTS